MIDPRTSVVPRDGPAPLRSASREAGAGSAGSRQRLRSGAAALHPDPPQGPSGSPAPAPGGARNYEGSPSSTRISIGFLGVLGFPIVSRISTRISYCSIRFPRRS